LDIEQWRKVHGNGRRGCSPETYTPQPIRRSNISTYIALYDYGYRNVCELGALIDINASRLELESRFSP
jgi:hypothetical protein